MIKRIFCVIITLFTLFMFSINSYAVSYNAYGSVTTSSSQVQLLIGFYLNSPYYKTSNEFIVLRTGQYDYKLFTAEKLSDNDIHVISYTRSSDNEYHISESDISTFSYNLGNYTAVGNVNGTLLSYDYSRVNLERYLYVNIIFIIIILLFTIFRVKDHKYV